LVTGVAGFIGSPLAQQVIGPGRPCGGHRQHEHYYDVTLKEARLRRLIRRDGFKFVKVDLANKQALAVIFAENRFNSVVNLVAQAGVPYS
jgi:UDP-glucuronate 4-epimerase